MTNRDRDEVFLELTRSICPVCKRTVDAEANARDNQVFLRKRCPEHVEFEARVYGNAEMYVDSGPGRLRRPSGADRGASHRRAEPDDRPGARDAARDGALDYVLLVAENPCD
jgi:hypothetical protein